MIKFFAWENLFHNKLTQTRDYELTHLRSYIFAAAVSRMIYYTTPVVVCFVTFLTYTKLSGHELDATTAFTALALFSGIRAPLQLFPDIVVRCVDARISLGRVQAFLDEPDLEKYTEDEEPTPVSGSRTGCQQNKKGEKPVLGFSGPANFSWCSKGKLDKKRFTLKDLDVIFPPEKLSLVIGPTGSGKSSLVLALLGGQCLFF